MAGDALDRSRLEPVSPSFRVPLGQSIAGQALEAALALGNRGQSRFRRDKQRSRTTHRSAAVPACMRPDVVDGDRRGGWPMARSG